MGRRCGWCRASPRCRGPVDGYAHRRAIWVATRPSLEAHRGGTLRVVFPYRPLSLDPVDFTVHAILALQADGLVGYRRVGGIGGSTLMPALAQSIPGPTSGGTEYTFRLRPGLVYSDGTPVRARDFRRAIERLFQVPDPFSETTTHFYFSAVQGADGCPDPPVERCDLSEGIVTDDEAGTVTFRLSAPDAEFLYKLAMPFAYPVAETVPMNDLVSGAFPGTGPYTVTSFSEEEIRLVRNPHFQSWDPDVRPDGFADEIVYSFGIEPEQQAEMVAAGDADYMAMRLGNRVAPGTLGQLRAAFTSQLYLGSISTMTAFINPAFPPFDRVEVRQAVNLAIDRGQVADAFGGEIGVNITCQVLPPAWPGYQPYCPYTRDADAGGGWHGPDLDAARRLVDASGTAGAEITVGPITARNARIGEHLVTVLNSIGYQATLDPATDDETVFGALDEGRIAIGVGARAPGDRPRRGCGEVGRGRPLRRRSGVLGAALQRRRRLRLVAGRKLSIPPRILRPARSAVGSLVRKVSGYRKPSSANEAAFADAVAEVAAASRRLLDAVTAAHPEARRAS
ncbi:MAG: DUF2277 family protein [Chloroflexi bacterium]|nr:DUF2277 family protein [Chloroflexota bacterium]